MSKEKAKRKRSVLAVALTVLMLCTASFALLGCGNKTADQLVLEAEKAVVEGTPSGSGKLFTASANSNSTYVTSNTKYIANLAKANNSVTWVFSAESEGAVNLNLVLANGTKGAAEFTAGGGKVFTLKLNGADVPVASFTVAAASEYCDNWQTVAVGSVNVKTGYNTLKLEIVDVTGAVNIDYLGIEKDKIGVLEHNHTLKNDTRPASCIADGSVYRKCSDCGINYLFDSIAALGHDFGNFHYDDGAGKMVKECRRCAEKEFADAPTSKYFGEVFEEKNEFSVRTNEVVFEAENANIDYSVGGLNNGKSPIEVKTGVASGDKLVGNISNLGNFIEFNINATKACKSDLVLVLANVLWTEDGIGILDPMSKYVSFSVNGEEVNFSFVAFPGDADYNYYNWRYVVMKNIDLAEGANSFKFMPVDNEDNITIPNTDVLNIYTDEAGIVTIERTYDINSATVDGAFTSQFTNRSVLSKVEGEQKFAIKASEDTKADFVLSLSAAEAVKNLGAEFSLTLNGLSVNLENLELISGSNNKLILKDVKLNIGSNTVAYPQSDKIAVDGIEVYTEKALKTMLQPTTDSAYDYVLNEGNEGAKVPKLTFEAEEATLKGNTTDGKDAASDTPSASGGKTVERFNVSGNSITWDFTLSANATVDLALRLACSNWDGSGNSDMTDLSRFFMVKIDGVALDLSEMNLTCADGSSWYDFTMLVVKGLAFAAGDHKVEIIVTSGLPNLDVLYVYSDDDVTVNKKAIPIPPQEETVVLK